MQPLFASIGPQRAPRARRGAALLLSLLVMFVLVLIVFQISISTSTDARVSRNEETLRLMDETIESVLLQVYEDLKADGEAGAGGGGGASDPAAAGGLPGAGSGGLDGAAGGGGPTDSKEDDWARPQRTEMNELRVRIFIQDEDSKFNLLQILTEDEDEAEKARNRLARVIENSRKGTAAEIDPGDAGKMADLIVEFVTRRRDMVLPKPILRSDDEDEENIGLPLSLREFLAIDPEVFTEDLFRDYRDEYGEAVHSLGSFLTVWTSVTTRADQEAQPADPTQEGGNALDPEDDEEANPDEDDEEEDPLLDTGSGQLPDSQGGADPTAAGTEAGSGKRGIAVNINTAPLAVLDALMDSRDMPRGFWQDVLEYRNEEDEDAEENEEPALDEYGEEIIVKQFFASLEELNEIDGWTDLEPIQQTELSNLLDVKSEIFSIYITVRRPTGMQDDAPIQADRRQLELEEEEGRGLIRTVRSVVWRRTDAEGTVDIVPIIRWEVLDYVPIEVLDYPDERR